MFAVSTALAQNSGMNTAAELPSAAAEHALMKFEQPLTERMRTFLRVEFLYEQTLFHVDEPTEFSARAAVDRAARDPDDPGAQRRAHGRQQRARAPRGAA